MADTLEELQEIVAALKQLGEQGRQPEILGRLNILRHAAEAIRKAWSGSWLGYHANVYYEGFQSPRAGASFSTEWGLEPGRFVPDATTGSWIEYDPDDVARAILERTGGREMVSADDFDRMARVQFTTHKNDMLSILELEWSSSQSEFMANLKEDMSKIMLLSEDEHLDGQFRGNIISRDRRALNGGRQIPPHARVLAQIASRIATVDAIASLAETARRVASHVSRQRQMTRPGSSMGTKVFIGHGHSPVWRELKDFLEDQLGLEVEEFNRVSTAGVSIANRLMSMLNSTTIAFLVMTGEDEQSHGELRPRENVVHEAGLFQGRLGFERAIILLEDGCTKFSNNTGLGHIKFPEQYIRAAFQDVRDVLEREGVLKPRAVG